MGCKAVVIACMDYRFHAALDEYLHQQGLDGQYDLISLPGACRNYRSHQLLEMVELAVRLHEVSASICVCHHQDGGA